MWGVVVALEIKDVAYLRSLLWGQIETPLPERFDRGGAINLNRKAWNTSFRKTFISFFFQKREGFVLCLSFIFILKKPFFLFFFLHCSFLDTLTTTKMKNLVIALALLAVFAAVQSMPAGKYRLQLFDQNCTDFCIFKKGIFLCHLIESLFIVCTPFSNTRVSS